jgi:hypothetical protein
METNLEHKSLLAKLLAQENINVIHSNVKTAYFDLETRTIYIPKWSDVSSELIDMLEGHEVGHAMFTPKDGWHNAVENGGALKSYLNVLEDVRIERKIKNMYPGLRYSFNTAYKQLHDRDFFGLSNYKINDLNLIDRINIFYKLGGHVRVPFSAEETLILNRINKIETWEDVEALARELYAKETARIKDEKRDSQEDEEDEDEEDYGEDYSEKSEDDSETDFESFDEEDDSDDSEEEGEDVESDGYGDDDESEDSEGDDDDSEDDERSDAIAGEPENGSVNDSEIDSLTDRNFRKMENLLVDNAEKYVNAFVPKFDDDILVSSDVLHASINAHIDEYLKTNKDNIFKGGNVISPENVVKENRNDNYKNFIARSSNAVNYMVKEFEMRKNASQLSRTKVSKSGDIDPNKLARYSITSDIFNRVSSVKEGKSHGLVIFIDLSGSMQDKIVQTFEQAIALTMFCRKVGIPFDVYGFTDNEHNTLLKKNKTNQNYEPKVNYLNFNSDPLVIKQYLSSKMKKPEYDNACMNMLFVAFINSGGNLGYYRDFMPNHEMLNGTPLDAAVVASIEVVNKFKSQYNLDLVNCVFLTDGDSIMTNSVYGENLVPKSHSVWYNSKIAFYVQYPNTSFRVKYQNFAGGYADLNMSTRAFVELARKVTGCKYTGYFISDRKDILTKLRMYQMDNDNQSDKMIRSKLTEEKHYSSNKYGFDEYFMVIDNSIKIEDAKMTAPEKPTKNALYRAFSNSIRTQNTQRLFLSKFMQNIAT